jgi:hypothetical protein
MSSASLDLLINEFPEEQVAVERLAAFLDSASSSAPYKRELTVQRLYELIKPSSQRVLAKLLTRLVEQRVFKKVVRVESDALGGIGDFESILDVPLVLFDSRMGREIEVRPDQIHLIYKLEQPAN